MSVGDPDLASDPQARALLIAAIERELKRLKRRLAAIDKDIARENDARELQTRAELLVASKLPKRGATTVEAIDYRQDPPAPLVIALDPTLDPRAQLEGWFKTARRYQRGAELGRQRAQATQVEIDALNAAHAVLSAPDVTHHAIAQLISDPRIGRLSAVAPQSKPRTLDAGTRRPFREFLGFGGATIWVGRGARDNDMLTTKVARPQDMFLHVHDATGAHVIIPRNKGQQVPPELLLDAATLAHHFSAAKNEARSDVTYAERRFVQKRRGSPPGTVSLLKGKVLRLVFEPSRLARLMAAERRASP